jgi:SNF2 family DNA or RNA helicase
LNEIGRAAFMCKNDAGESRPFFQIGGGRDDKQDWDDACAKVKRDGHGAGPVLAVQLQAGEVGIDLTAARYVVYYSLGFSLLQYRQSRARVYRPGQKRPVHYYHLIVPGTVDRLVYSALNGKTKIVDSVVSSLVNPEQLAKKEARK